LVEALPALGAVDLCEGRLVEGEQEFKRAFALNANYALAHHWYAMNLEAQGRLDDALTEVNQAIELDPLSVTARYTRGRFLIHARRFAEALADLNQVQVLRPDMLAPSGLKTTALLALGKPEEALAAARTVVAGNETELRLNADFEAIGVLSRTGHADEAAAHLVRLQKRLPENCYIIGLALGAQGKWDDALPFLEQIPPTMWYILYWHPTWDRWRDEPRFQQLVAKLGCNTEYQAARASLARIQSNGGGK